MKFKLLIFSLFFISVKNYAQIDSIFLYNSDSSKQFLYYQQDVFSFHLDNDEHFTSNDTIIAGIDYFKNNTINVVTFKQSSNIIQRNLLIQNIVNQLNFDYECLTVSNSKNAINDFSSKDYHVTYPSLTVNFYANLVDSAIIDSFARRNNLTLTHSPSSSLPNQFSWSFFFSMDSAHIDTNFIVCQKIFENEAIVKFIEPAMSMFYDYGIPNPTDFDIELSINEELTNSVLIYPNPTNGYLTINNNFTDNERFRIINSNGTIVYNNELKQNKTNIDLSKLSIPNGIYYIVFNNKKVQRTKIIFQ